MLRACLVGLSAFSLYLTFVLFPSLSSAHPGNTAADGCHYCRTNCDKWGVPWNVRHCHNGGGTQSAYSPPIKVCPKPDLSKAQANWTFTEDRASCTHNIKFNLVNIEDSDDYSIYLSKSTRDEPDNISDPIDGMYLFQEVESGRHYVHLKAKNSCGWSNNNYWTVDVPVVKPSIRVKESVISEDERELAIQTTCAKNITAIGVGSIPVTKEIVTIKPTKDTDYVFTAKNGAESATATVSVLYPLPTPTPSPSPTPIPTLTPAPTESRSFSKSLFRFLRFNP